MQDMTVIIVYMGNNVNEAWDRAYLSLRGCFVLSFRPSPQGRVEESLSVRSNVITREQKRFLHYASLRSE
jgi:hypothetical protein